MIVYPFLEVLIDFHNYPLHNVISQLFMNDIDFVLFIEDHESTVRHTVTRRLLDF